MQDNKTLILHELRYENLSSSQIAKRTGLSQPTVSRALKSLPVIKIGGGRTTVFALIDELKSSETLYQVADNGKFYSLGELHPQPYGRMVLQQAGGHTSYESIPYYLYDVIPAGFLGSLVLKNIVGQDPVLTSKSQEWTDKQVWHYLTHFGQDLTGNFVLSNRMAEKASEYRYPVHQRDDYLFISESINKTPDNLGSSVAGEQPKFTIFNGDEHLIVKYSPLEEGANPITTRYRDLMICEHLALEALYFHGILSAKSELFFDKRIFLEIVRFDRIQEHGRRGMVSLKMLDAEYTGINSDWPSIGKGLLQKGMIQNNNLFTLEVAYAFGKYIANTDMHNGNFSFFMDGLTINGATPIYDMLPMAFTPKQGEIPNIDIAPPRFINVSSNAQELALKTAKHFWNEVVTHPKISEDFKVFCVKPFVEQL